MEATTFVVDNNAGRTFPGTLVKPDVKEKVMLKVHTTKLGNVTVLCVQGKIVRGETDSLRGAVLAEANASVIVLDLAHVNTIDAGGLGVMLELRQHTQSKGIEFRLKNVTRLVRRVLEITQLYSVFEGTTDLKVLSPRTAHVAALTAKICA
jgi:anti-anti-sigma factor